MHPFLSDQSLKDLLNKSGLSSEKKVEYETLIPTLNVKGRSALFDFLVSLYELTIEEKGQAKARAAYHEFAKDTDYDKLLKNL